MLNYTAIDFETANSYRGSPCAVGLVRVRDGIPVTEQRWLMRPPEAVDHFDPFNTWIHGITDDMVANEPRWKQLLPNIVDFIGDDVVVAHNAGFDIGVIRYACAADNIEWPEMRFLCTMVLARRALQLPSYRLPFVADALGGSIDGHHDPLSDARAVVTIVRGLATRSGADDLDALAGSVGVCIGRMSPGIYLGSVVRSGGMGLVRPDLNPKADPDGYLYDHVVVFTGTLMSMTRQIAWEECARIGAIAEYETTKRTNVLVIGDVNPAVLRPGATLTAKARRAFELQAKGQDIEVMTEDDFLRCLDGNPLDGADILLRTGDHGHEPPAVTAHRSR
jgi:DNA polymerase III epsilon subunit-like protein